LKKKGKTNFILGDAFYWCRIIKNKKMKTLIFTLIISLAFLEANSQENSIKPRQNFNVPEVVKKTFATKFPNATNVKWGAAKDSKYEADFTLNKHEVSAFFNPKGILVKTDTELNEAELPKTIKAYLSNSFKGYKISEIDKLEIKGKTTYKMEAKNDKFEYDLEFDKNGKVLLKEKYSIDD
jgi:hypothetical protein